MQRRGWLLFAAPAAALFLAFWLLPMASLVLTGATVEEGHSAYYIVVTSPQYWRSLFNTVALSLVATLATLATLLLSLPIGRFLAWHREFPDAARWSRC